MFINNVCAGAYGHQNLTSHVFLYQSLLVYVVCVCTYSCVLCCMSRCVNIKDWCWFYPCVTLHHVFWDEVSHWSRSSLIWLDQSAMDHQRFTRLLTSSRIIGTHCWHAQDFSFTDLNSGPYACPTSTLLMSQHPSFLPPSPLPFPLPPLLMLCNKFLVPGAGMMAQWFKVLISLEEHPGLVLRTHIAVHTCHHSSSKGSNTLLEPPRIPGTHVLHIHTCKQNLYASTYSVQAKNT